MGNYLDLSVEIRSGYQVTEKLKKIWDCELHILQELLSVCEKYDLRVILFAGTMLGAVRHGGFIPWDDDLDVAMPREDFEKLIKVADKEFREPLFFQSALSDRKFFCGYARLRDSRTTGMITWNKSAEYNNGIYVDIYVLDGMSSNKNKVKIQFVERKIIEQFLKVYYADSTYKSKKARWMVRILKDIANLFDYEKIYNVYVKILTRYNKDSEKIAMLTHEYANIEKYSCYKEDCYDTIDVQYETIQAPIPKEYDRILKNIYNDYMKFPPANERGTWHNNQIEFEPNIPYKEYIEAKYGE